MEGLGWLKGRLLLTAVVEMYIRDKPAGGEIINHRKLITGWRIGL
jgi:hypothetical protein